MKAREPRPDTTGGACTLAAGGKHAGDAALAELFEYAGMRAEEAFHTWHEERRRLNLGLDAYGGACVIMTVGDRKLLNALKRIGAVEKGTYSGDWDVKRTWAHRGQECGVECAMAEVVCKILNASLGDRAHAHVHSWWS